jgi:glyceraldehyde 3-phosphate dehydrogenase
MTTKVGLMGFGRIGRNLFRILYKRDDIQVTAVSDVADHKNLEYLLKYDTIMGRFPEAVSVREGALYTYGRQVKMLSGPNPATSWGGCVDVVVERRRHRSRVGRNISTPGKRVILCVPPLDEPDITVVMGKRKQLKAEHRIISTARSPLTAPLRSPIIDGALVQKRMFFATVHAYKRPALADAGGCSASRGSLETSFPPIPTRRGVTNDAASQGKITGMA